MSTSYADLLSLADKNARKTAEQVMRMSVIKA